MQGLLSVLERDRHVLKRPRITNVPRGWRMQEGSTTASSAPINLSAWAVEPRQQISVHKHHRFQKPRTPHPTLMCKCQSLGNRGGTGYMKSGQAFPNEGCWDGKKQDGSLGF